MSAASSIPLLLLIGHSIFGSHLTPFKEVLKIPRYGIRALTDEAADCKISSEDRNVTIGYSNGVKIFLKDCYSGGSGNWSTISVAIGDSSVKTPKRGFKLSTSTTGFFFLHDFHGQGLPWLKDLDQDGNVELILWDTFGGGPGMGRSSTGLVPWSYKFQEEKFVFDRATSCLIQQETANIYRKRRKMDKSPKCLGCPNPPYWDFIQTLENTRRYYCGKSKKAKSDTSDTARTKQP